MSIGRPTAIRRRRLLVEYLEARQLLSGYQPTANEQLFLEQLNDARANPAAYGASIGLDLSNVAPAQPLAFNPDLIESALVHSQDMSNRAYFSHYTPEGLDPGARMTQAGFFWNSWGESIAGGSAYPNTGDALSALILDNGVPDLGHRRQLLSIDAMYQDQNQVGIGVVQGGSGPLVNYYTIDTASSPGAGPFLAGVVFNDLNGNGKYDIGEGLAGVTIAVNGMATANTWDTGGYTIALTAGTYTVTASGGGLAAPITRVVTLNAGNVRLNFTPANDTDIRKFYQTILGRPGSDAEVASWLPALEALGPAPVASEFEHSAEARTNLVKSWYVTYLGRPAQNDEWQGWVTAMLNGLSEADAMAGILGSPEFYYRAGTLSASGSADERYVQALYALLLQRDAGTDEVNGWLAGSAGAPLANLAEGFLHSKEYRADAVRGYYTTILHRQAAPADAEVSYWASSDLDLTTIRVEFEASYEFYLHG